MAGGPTPFVNAFDHPQLNSLRYNTSQAGSPVFLCYGTCRVSVNLLEFWGFTGSKGGKGGKGLGGSGGKKGSNQNYSVNVAMGLCQGPVSFGGASHGFGGANRVWANGGVSYTNRVGLNGYVGNDGQSPDPIFASSDPNTPVIGYSGTAYATGTPMQLGSSPALPNMQVEVTGFQAGTAGPVFPDDARADHIVTDLLTNSRYGAGFPSANLDTTAIADWGNYCQAASLAMSLLLDKQQPAARWIEEIAQLTVAAVVWSGSKLKIIPYSDQAFTGNGTTWSPALTAAYALDDGDFLSMGDSDPVELTRTDPAQATNWLSVEYMDSVNNFDVQVIPMFDQGLIDLFGLRSEPSVQAHEFTNATSAAVSAQLMLRRKAYVRNTYKFKLGWRFSRLEPMDIVEITDATLGLVTEPVRITDIEEDDNGELTITAEELPGNPFVLPAVQSTAGDPLDFLADPGDANTPVIFEPPRQLTGGDHEVWLIATGGPEWGGCIVYISTDGSTYAQAGTIYRGGREGVLTATFPSHADPDTTDTLSVDLSMCQGQLLSGTSADADNFVTLCILGGSELVSYQNATLTAAYHYDLGTKLRRGVYGTPIGSHGIGDSFARFGPNDPSLFRYVYPSSFVGQTIYIKLVSFNQFGQALQDIAGVTAYTFILNGNGAIEDFSIPFQYAGIPQNTLPILIYTFPQAVDTPLDLAGSVGNAGTAATVTTDFNLVLNNSTTIGTMTFVAGSHTATFSVPAQSFVAGDVLVIVPTRTDATLSGISGYLLGSS